MKVDRYWTHPDRHVFDVEWATRDARIGDVFHQEDVMVPSAWSMNATNIVAQKYFRTHDDGTKERSVKDMINRVVDKICDAGVAFDYFHGTDDSDAFADELSYLLLHQMMSFNSPVWFNVGIEEKPQCSACFILNVEDEMTSILDWYYNEGMIFKNGSGAGANLSKIRSSYEPLSNGGIASGPVSFMRGADASAGAIKSGGKTRRAAKMVILDVDHPDIEEFIWTKYHEESKARVLEEAGYDMSLNGRDAVTIQYQNANNSVRVTDEFMQAVENDIDWMLFGRDGKRYVSVLARDLFHDIATAAHGCADPGMQYHDTINAWHTIPKHSPIVGSNPCSEYMHINDSACNLASLNLVKFQTPDGTLDVRAFRHAVAITTVAMDILVSMSSYPTSEIADNAEDYRQLGLGFTNLGAYLMRAGIPYESEVGCAAARFISSVMCGEAYLTSTHLAEDLSPFANWLEHSKDTIRVLEQHARFAVGGQDKLIWRKAIERAKEHGVRNSQTTVIAPTGTISFMMDCDTTGIEPDFGLVKRKTLVGGGHVDTINASVVPALNAMGLNGDQQDEVLEFIEEYGEVNKHTPHLTSQQRKVFRCAVGYEAISPGGHLEMMAAVQPLISGAISKTVNMPAESTVEDVQNVFMAGWKLGLKAVAVYVDGSKVAQPLRSSKAKIEMVREERHELPRRRKGTTTAFTVGDAHGYLTTGEYEDGKLGEIFVKLGKQGTTLSGVLDAFAVSVSLGLQYGVPLEVYVDKFRHMTFQPAGITEDEDVRIAQSIIDYVARRLEIDYIGTTFTPVTQPVVAQSGLLCSGCGGTMQRSGSCLTCTTCGNNTGCS